MPHHPIPFRGQIEEAYKYATLLTLAARGLEDEDEGAAMIVGADRLEFILRMVRLDLDTGEWTIKVAEKEATK